jgi:hypothetical protein
MKKAGRIAAAFAAVAIAGMGIAAEANKDALLKDAVARNDGITATVALRVLGANPNAEEGFLLADVYHNSFMAKQFIAAGYDLNNRGACTVLDGALQIDHKIAGILLDAGFKPNTPDCNVLPRIADGWYNRDHGIMNNDMLRKVLAKGRFSEDRLDEAMAGAAAFNPDTRALSALRDAGANPGKALQIIVREYNSPEGVLTLLNDQAADPSLNDFKAATEAEIALRDLRDLRAKNPSPAFSESERRCLQTVRILNTPSL